MDDVRDLAGRASSFLPATQFPQPLPPITTQDLMSMLYFEGIGHFSNDLFRDTVNESICFSCNPRPAKLDCVFSSGSAMHTYALSVNRAMDTPQCSLQHYYIKRHELMDHSLPFSSTDSRDQTFYSLTKVSKVFTDHSASELTEVVGRCIAVGIVEASGYCVLCG